MDHERDASVSDGGAVTHTPGPWRIALHDHKFYIDAEVPCGLWLIAKTTGCSENDEADARLIGAAPEMLETLKLAYLDIDAAIIVTERKFQQSALGLRQTIQKIKTVIAKAEGRTMTAQVSTTPSDPRES